MTANVAADEAPPRRRAPASDATTSTSARPAAPKAIPSEAVRGREEVLPPAAMVAGSAAGAAVDSPARSLDAGAATSDGKAADGNDASAPGGAEARLEWRAPAACPTRADVLWHIGNLADSEELRWGRFERIRAGVERRGAGWGLALEFVASGGIRRRTMTSAHCADLAEAAAVAIVLALRSNAAGDDWQGLNASTAASTSESAPELAVQATGPQSSEQLREPATGDLAAESVPLAVAAEAEAMIDPNTLGPAAFGASAGVSLGLGDFSTALYAAAFPSATTELGPSQSIALALWTGGLRGCYRWGRGLDACALMELGRVSAEGIGLVRAREGRDLWATPGLSVAFTAAPFDGWGITTRLSAFHPLVRGRYRVDEGTTVHHLPAIGFRAALGIHVPFL